jgi:hypothetical protein
MFVERTLSNTRLLSGFKLWQKLHHSPSEQLYLVFAGDQNLQLEHGHLMPWHQGIVEL